MVSVCTVPARGRRLCERFGGYKTINGIPLYLTVMGVHIRRFHCNYMAAFLW